MKFLDVKTDYAFKRVFGSASSVPLLISFLNAILDYAGNFVMQEKTQFIQYSDDIELVFIELPKFNKTLEDLSDMKEKWIYFVKNAGKLDYIPDALQEPCIAQALSMANEASLSKEELELQHRRHDFILLQQGSLELAEAKGIEQGRQEGEQAKALEIARNLLDVLDDSTIAAKTGLSVDDVQALR
jgi:predicted transposase/invertase (TIGR01784 family)